MELSGKAILEIQNLSFEAERLSKGSAAERARSQVLVQRIATLKQLGLSSDELRAKYAGALLEDISGASSVSDVAWCKAFKRYLVHGDERELRDMVAGSSNISYTAGQQGGFTVPISFAKSIFEAMAQVDPLLSPQVCSFWMENSPTLQPKQLRGWDLSTVSASLIGEAQQQTQMTAPLAAQKLLRGNLIYKSTFAASIELEQDANPDLLDSLRRAFGVSFARKLGSDAILGNGTTAQPQGVFTAVPASGVTIGTGAVAFGTPQPAGNITAKDIHALYFSVDRIYRAQPKCAWLCGDGTWQALRNAVDNQGRPLISLENGREEILGKPLYVCPSIPSPGGSPISNGTILFGDLAHFFIRVSTPTVMRELESSIGGIERGEVLYVARVRMDSALFDPSNGTKPPIVSAVVQHA